ncbi:acyltransferase [uncultured Clostridium sp.]|uniref:acyltransferase family protein n=1 Tax=uncultured Clostridium sp. TaxID=59620 RepID=UPI0025E9A181|nr:acyltransferase [uncultured Clostridium sp.]
MEFDKNDTLMTKGFAIILMLTHHLYAFPDRILNNNYYNSIFQIWGKNIEYLIGDFGKICVCVFIFLSGFGTYKSFDKNRNVNFISNRLIKFYRVYWSVFIIFILLGVIMRYPREISIYEFINNITCYKITYNGEWWFATPFICIMLITPILIEFLEKDNSRIFFYKAIIFIITLAVFQRTILPNIIKIDFFKLFSQSSYYRILKNVLMLLPSYLMGYLIAKYRVFEIIREKMNYNKFLMIVFSVLGLCIVFVCRSKTGKQTDWDYFYAPITILLFTNIVRDIKYIKSIFISLGKKSAYIWLVHSFFCYQYFQDQIFVSHNPIIILLMLLCVSYITALIIETLNNFIDEKSKYLIT